MCVCTVEDLTVEDKASGVKICTVVRWCPGLGITFWGTLLPQKPKIGRQIGQYAH